MSGTKVTDKGVKELNKLERLTELNLNLTEVGDNGLQALASLKNLAKLFLIGTKATKPGIAVQVTAEVHDC